MLGTIIYAAGDVRVEERPDPTILEPTDAIIRVTAACVCGSDLWPFRGADTVNEPTAMGHEYVGVVEQVGDAVTTVKPGQFVIGSFAASDNTCPNCLAGHQTSCVHREFMSGAQAELLRVPLADGTLVATPAMPAADLIPSLLALSDVTRPDRRSHASSARPTSSRSAATRAWRGSRSSPVGSGPTPSWSASAPRSR